jgi:hypothetical protein
MLVDSKEIIGEGRNLEMAADADQINVLPCGVKSVSQNLLKDLFSGHS